MLNQQRKKLKSHEKDSYFRKTSPNNRRPNRPDGFAHKKTLEIPHQSPKEYLENQNRNRQLSFLKFIPQSAKNLNRQRNVEDGGYKNMKELKIPSFFKKPMRGVELSNKQESKENSRLSSKDISRQDSQKPSLQESTRSNKQRISQPGVNGQLSQYKKLNDKINYLHTKILQMKDTLNKKRQEKLNFMEAQKTQRASIVSTDEDISSCSSTETPLKQFVTQVPQHKDLHAFTQNPYSPRHSLYYVSEILRAYREQKSLTRQHILTSVEYIKMFKYSKIPDEKYIEHLKVNLPKPSSFEDKKTIVFDLDETLIHCNQNVHMPSDIKIKINFPTGQLIQVGINIRPYAKQILAALSKKFQIIVFTASHSCYANVVLDHLDPEKKYIHHRLFRQHCFCTPEGIYVKDLRILNRNLAKVILVDNAAYSYAYQLLNGVPIIPYYQGNNDYQLPALQKYLQSLIFSYDVREKNRQMFKLDRYTEFDSLHTLVQTLYTHIH